MTGFGRAIAELEDKKITIEIKSLNSKQIDILSKLPSYYKEKEIIIRNIIAKKLERGKVELNLKIDSFGNNKAGNINNAIVENYYNQLNSIANSLNIKYLNENIFQSILSLPDIISTEDSVISNDEWTKFKETLNLAITELIEFRSQEGLILEKDFLNRIEIIEGLLNKIPEFEDERKQKIRTKLKNSLNELSNNIDIDKNRYEQELIYYLEKYDITEEKVRLANHCKYFIKTISENKSVGKKLIFISQEIGREINTIGSKANHSEIQKIVVQMKDELEKIKEQLLNIL